MFIYVVKIIGCSNEYEYDDDPIGFDEFEDLVEAEFKEFYEDYGS